MSIVCFNNSEKATIILKSLSIAAGSRTAGSTLSIMTLSTPAIIVCVPASVSTIVSPFFAALG